jgi:hypothetical protein
VARFVVVLLIACALLAGCGGADAPAPQPTPEGNPSLGRDKPDKGEILIRGDLTPASHGPYDLDGRYKVAFEQYAPEDPELDFTQQTSFVAMLDKEAEFERPDSIKLFETSRRAASKRVALHGRYFVDVSFGDFPYVVRFTPRDRAPAE